jgi:ankyrin repeat protein
MKIFSLLLAFTSILTSDVLISRVSQEYLTLQSYIETNDYQSFKSFFDKNSVNPNKYNIYVPTLLVKSAKNNNIKFVVLLNQKGIDLNFISGITRTTAAHIAIDNKNYKVADYLIRKIKNLNIQDYNGQTLLHFAVNNSANTIIKLLLEKGANKYIKNKQGKIPFDLARRNLGIDIFVLKKLNSKSKKEINFKIHDKLKNKKIQIKLQNSKIINKLKMSRINDRLKSSKRINVYDKKYIKENIYIGN